MNIIDIINKTKKSQELNEEEIGWLVRSFTNGDVPDYQMSAWLCASTDLPKRRHSRLLLQCVTAAIS